MQRHTPQRFAIEFGIAALLVGVLVAILVPALARSREASGRASCQNNLKQLGIVMKMYAGENNGRFPPLSQVPDNWAMDMRAIYPDYLTDISVLVCPSSLFADPGIFDSTAQPDPRPEPECVSSLFYIYTGFVIFSDEQAIALYAQYGDRRRELLEAGDVDLLVPVWPNSGRVGFAGQATTPVMWDRVPLRDDEFAHTPNGINVLHEDGHVEYVRYSPYNNSNYFPATRASAETFGSTLPRLPAHCRGG